MKFSFHCWLVIWCVACSSPDAHAQSLPYSLRSDVQVVKKMNIRQNAVRLAWDDLSQTLYYNTSEGKIYRINPDYSETLVYDTSHHHVQYMMGFIIRDSVMYVSGNNNIWYPHTTGIVVKGKLNPGGSRTWTTIVKTAAYETAGAYDHAMGGLVLNPGGDSIFFSNGSRGDHGEAGSNGGLFPGLRNTPLTTHVFGVPVNAQNLLLLYDSTWLANSGYLFVSGVRNFFDMAYCGNGDLFAVENSGDRDHNEEMNWLRKGRHYGFPWVMGETVNAAQFPGYDFTKDKLLADKTYGRSLGIFYNDTTFPPPPPGLVFTDPVVNMGPDADKYRDTSGLVYDASDQGKGLKTFTAHRSPLGLFFDTDSLLGAPFTGHGFTLSYSKGVDSLASYPPNNTAAPFMDPSEDLLHLELIKDLQNDNYRMYTTRIVGGFHNPVDAQQVGNKVFVIENQYQDSAALYKITLPGRPASGPQRILPQLFPNPSFSNVFVRFTPKENQIKIIVTDMQGRTLFDIMQETTAGKQQTILLPLASISPGMYICQLYDGTDHYTQRIVLIH